MEPWDDHQKEFLNDEPRIESESDDFTDQVPSSEEKKRKDTRLITLRAILKRRREAKDIMNSTNQSSTQNVPSAMPLPLSASAEKSLHESTEIVDPNDKSLTPQSQTLEMVKSPSMNLLDESANHIFDLMRGLHANQPSSEIKAYDPDRVNAACNCAKQIYSIMRLKLDSLKIQLQLQGKIK